jgi:heme/copper-type cytochrome/quinol oxidase subunit 3
MQSPGNTKLMLKHRNTGNTKLMLMHRNTSIVSTALLLAALANANRKGNGVDGLAALGVSALVTCIGFVGAHLLVTSHRARGAPQSITLINTFFVLTSVHMLTVCFYGVTCVINAATKADRIDAVMAVTSAAVIARSFTTSLFLSRLKSELCPSTELDMAGSDIDSA